MNHAISNAGSLEAAHYREIDRIDWESRRDERRAIRTAAMLREFSADDVLDAALCGAEALSSSEYHTLTMKLAESLASLVTTSPTEGALELLAFDMRNLAKHHAEQEARRLV